MAKYIEDTLELLEAQLAGQMQSYLAFAQLKQKQGKLDEALQQIMQARERLLKSVLRSDYNQDLRYKLQQLEKIEQEILASAQQSNE